MIRATPTPDEVPTAPGSAMTHEVGTHGRLMTLAVPTHETLMTLAALIHELPAPLIPMTLSARLVGPRVARAVHTKRHHAPARAIRTSSGRDLRILAVPAPRTTPEARDDRRRHLILQARESAG